jgi:hypothetical protein
LGQKRHKLLVELKKVSMLTELHPRNVTFFPTNPNNARIAPQKVLISPNYKLKIPQLGDQ